MTSPFKAAIQAAVSNEASMNEFVNVLREHKDLGLTQQEAYEALESLRQGAKERDEDRILGVMDMVSGFCVPHHRVWPAQDNSEV